MSEETKVTVSVFLSKIPYCPIYC